MSIKKVPMVCSIRGTPEAPRVSLASSFGVKGSDGGITAFVSLADGLGATQEPALFMTAGMRECSALGGAVAAWPKSIRRKAPAMAPDQARQVAYCATSPTHPSGQSVRPRHRSQCHNTLVRRPPRHERTTPMSMHHSTWCGTGPWHRHSCAGAAAWRRCKAGTNHASGAMPCLQDRTASERSRLAVEPQGPPDQCGAHPLRHTNAGQTAPQQLT